MIKAYKGFNEDMTCRGFQYREGETFTFPEAKLCESGAHACTEPIDVLTYYLPSSSVYHEVELDDVSDQSGNDSKICGKKIEIGARLSIAGLVEAQIKYVKNHSAQKNAPSATSDRGAASATSDRGAASATGNRGAASATGNRGAASATGNRGAASATGNRGAASATGYCGAASATGNRGAASATSDRGAASATGDRGAASATGYCGAASATGNCGAASATGYCGAASATGYCGAASATGDQGAASATGDRGAASATGEASVAMACGVGGKVLGKIGCALFAVERGEFDGTTYPITSVAAAIVDGAKIKEDTWYICRGGKLVEDGKD